MIKKMRAGTVPDDAFTIVSRRILRDRSLSLKAKGLYCLILSLPETWSFSARGLAMLALDGDVSVNTGLKELEAAGYIRREQKNDGGFSGGDCIVFDDPAPRVPSSGNAYTDNAYTDKMYAGNPRTVNRPQYINKKDITEDIKKEELNKEKIKKEDIKKEKTFPMFGKEFPVDRIIF